MSPVTSFRRRSSGKDNAGAALSNSTNSSTCPSAEPCCKSRIATRRPRNPHPPVMTMRIGSPNAVALRPPQAAHGISLRPVFAPDPALVADLVEQVEQVGVVELADIRLVPPGGAGDLRNKRNEREEA